MSNSDWDTSLIKSLAKHTESALHVAEWDMLITVTPTPAAVGVKLSGDGAEKHDMAVAELLAQQSSDTRPFFLWIDSEHPAWPDRFARAGFELARGPDFPKSKKKKKKKAKEPVASAS